MSRRSAGGGPRVAGSARPPRAPRPGGARAAPGARAFRHYRQFGPGTHSSRARPGSSRSGSDPESTRRAVRRQSGTAVQGLPFRSEPVRWCRFGGALEPGSRSVRRAAGKALAAKTLASARAGTSDASRRQRQDRVPGPVLRSGGDSGMRMMILSIVGFLATAFAAPAWPAESAGPTWPVVLLAVVPAHPVALEKVVAEAAVKEIEKD